MWSGHATESSTNQISLQRLQRLETPCPDLRWASVTPRTPASSHQWGMVLLKWTQWTMAWPQGGIASGTLPHMHLTTSTSSPERVICLHFPFLLFFPFILLFFLASLTISYSFLPSLLSLSFNRCLGICFNRFNRISCPYLKCLLQYILTYVYTHKVIITVKNIWTTPKSSSCPL